MGVPGAERELAVRLVHDLQPGQRPEHLVFQVMGDADVHYADLPGPPGPRTGIQARLAPGEGDRHLGLDRLPQDFPGVDVHPGGDVAGHHRAADPALHLQDGGAEHPCHRTGQADAKEGIHHHVAGRQPGEELLLFVGHGGLQGGAVGHVHGEVLQTAPSGDELVLHGPLVGGHFGPVPHEEGPDLTVSHPHQQAGGGHPVPTVVAGAAEHGDAGGGVVVLGLHNGPELVHLGLLLPGEGRGVLFACKDHDALAVADGTKLVLRRIQQLPHRLGHGVGGVLHQVQGGHPPLLDGPAVQLLHLRGGG